MDSCGRGNGGDCRNAWTGLGLGMGPGMGLKVVLDIGCKIQRLHPQLPSHPLK